MKLVAGTRNDSQQYEQHQHQSKVVEAKAVESAHSLSLLHRQLVIRYVLIAKRDWTFA